MDSRRVSDWSRKWCLPSDLMYNYKKENVDDSTNDPRDESKHNGKKDTNEKDSKGSATEKR
jgi:hypothetical protein